MRTTQKRLARPSLRGLLATRRGSLALALSCALVATGVLLLAMSQYRHAVAGGAKQSTVLVSTAEIQKGSSTNVIAADHLYRVVPVLGSQVSPGAIDNAGAIVGKVAADTILPGEQLTAADFTTPSGTGAVLAPSERAVAVTLDPAHGVAGVLEAGDQVDVYGSVGTGPNAVVGLLVPDALVLKAPSAGSSSATVLLGVSDQMSPRVMWMFDNGKVWLELRGANATNVTPTNIYEPQVFLGNRTTTTPTYDTAATGGSHR